MFLENTSTPILRGPRSFFSCYTLIPSVTSNLMLMKLNELKQHYYVIPPLSIVIYVPFNRVYSLLFAWKLGF